MKDNKNLTDYIAARNKADSEKGFNLPDKAMAFHVAFVFLTPADIFRLWIRSIKYKYLR
jgi:hypothetical protein